MAHDNYYNNNAPIIRITIATKLYVFLLICRASSGDLTFSGGGVLLRYWIQSPHFCLGCAGWSWDLPSIKRLCILTSAASVYRFRYWQRVQKNLLALCLAELCNLEMRSCAMMVVDSALWMNSNHVRTSSVSLCVFHPSMPWVSHIFY